MPFALLDCSESAKEICDTIGAQEGIFLLNGGENEQPKVVYSRKYKNQNYYNNPELQN